MRALLSYNSDSSLDYFGNFMLRQGLEPILDPLAPNRRLIVNGAAPNFGSNQMLYESPDHSKVVGYRQPNIAWYVPDITNPQFVPITTSFSGTIYESFCGNEYYGFVGDGTQLHVFDWATHSVKTLNKTGLGTVGSCSLDSSGKLLAVTHTITPFLRVYNLDTGTFTDAATPFAMSGACCWTKSGEWIVCHSSTSANAIVKYTANLQTKTIISNISSFTIPPRNSPNNTYGYMKPHPYKHNCVLSAPNGSYSSNSAAKFLEINAQTNALLEPLPRSYTENFYFEFDLVEDKIYFYTSLFDSTRASTTLVLDLNTYQQLPPPVSFGVTMDRSNATRVKSMTIINKNYGTLTGTIRDIDNNPGARTVRAYRRQDGLLVAQTFSDAETGDYKLILPTADTESYDVQFMAQDGEILNDLFFARSSPQPV